MALNFIDFNGNGSSRFPDFYRWFFFRPPAPPKIAEFASAAPVYQEASGDAIYLNWQIRQPQQLKAIKILEVYADSNMAVIPAVYLKFTQ